MSLSSQRPRHWSSVVGQDRPIRVLKAVLTTAKFMPRGYTFEGVRGIGKTTTALIAARAFMCTGDDPLGCGKCPSCQTADQSPELSTHPDFIMIDAASYSGVDKAHGILTALNIPPVLGRRRVLLVEEAHNFNRDAWDVYLAPLEKNDTNTVFLFATTDVERIPMTVRSRCCSLRFSRLSTDKIRGLLCHSANDNHVQYEMDAITTIARRSKGHPREALQMMNAVAAIGPVTKDLVNDVLENSLEDGCLKVLLSLLSKDLRNAVEAMDELTITHHPTKIVEAMFALFGNIRFGEAPVDEEDQKAYALVHQYFPDTSAITTLLIKWSSAGNLPADALLLFVEELAQIKEGKQQVRSSGAPTIAQALRRSSEANVDAPLSESDISRMLNAEKLVPTT